MRRRKPKLQHHQGIKPCCYICMYECHAPDYGHALEWNPMPIQMCGIRMISLKGAEKKLSKRQE